MRLGSNTAFTDVLKVLPLHILSHLKPRELLCLASTCICCKDAVTLAIYPKAQDVSEGQEFPAICCCLNLADVAALLETLYHFPTQPCQW